MPRRPPLIASLTVVALASCGFGAVSVESYEPDPQAEDTCAALLDDLPEVVDNAVRRDVEPESALAAAWGQPAIVLRCGVGLPSAYRPDAQLLSVEGIGWFVEEGDGGTFFTSTDREVMVEVAIPDDYAPEGLILQDLTPAIAAHLPERELR